MKQSWLFCGWSCLLLLWSKKYFFMVFVCSNTLFNMVLHKTLSYFVGYVSNTFYNDFANRDNVH